MSNCEIKLNNLVADEKENSFYLASSLLMKVDKWRKAKNLPFCQAIPRLIKKGLDNSQRQAKGLKYPPKLGQILLCDFSNGFEEPEMVKRRPVIVIASPMRQRPGLCTVVPLSTTPPNCIKPYHYLLKLDPLPPSPWDKEEVWVKADHILTVGYHRLDYINYPRSQRGGKRCRYEDRLTKEQIKKVRSCLLNGLGLFSLTSHL